MDGSENFKESPEFNVKTREVLAAEYGTTAKTLIRRLKKLGIVLPPGNIFPGTCKEIYDKLGVPAKLSQKSKDNNGKIVPDK
jgi:hypothetical protein